MTDLKHRLEALSYRLRRHVSNFTEHFGENPFRDTAELNADSVTSTNALRALGTIAELVPTTVRVWDIDKSFGQNKPMIDARTIHDILKQYHLVEGS